MENKINSGVKRAELEVTVIRANGTVEKLGIVSFYDRRWYMRLWFKVKTLCKKFCRKK